MMQIWNIPISNRSKKLYIGIAAIMGVVIIASMLGALYFEISRMETIFFKQLLAITGMLFAGILFLSSCFNIQENTHQGRILIVISALLFILLFLSGFADSMEGFPGTEIIFISIQTATSAISMTINYLMWKYQSNTMPQNRAKKYVTLWIRFICLIYVILLIVNVFTDILVYMDADGVTHYPGLVIEIIISILFYLTYLIYVLMQQCTVKQKVIFASYACFPLLVILFAIVGNYMRIDTNTLTFSYMFLLLAVYVVFIWDYREKQEQLYLKQKELAEQKQKQTEMQTALMLSQIRPHFLYNALTAIQDYCQNDPKGYTSIGMFADYLHANMDALENGRIIPFEKELEHIKIYLKLEQMRFEEGLKVEYDIQYQEFSVPALSIQPIVENAVRHGATMNENGGLIIIRTERIAEGAVITVTDNGPGFDPEVMPSDGRNHFGLKNVRSCLEVTGRGDLRIESTPGKGTAVSIYIWEDQNKE